MISLRKAEQTESSMNFGTDLPFAIRGGLEKDVAYILSSWKKSYAACPPQRWISNGYYGHMNQACAAIMQRAKATMMVDASDTTYIVGWFICDDDCLHYCYVRPEFRKLGVMRTMLIDNLPSSILYCSHLTEDGGKLVASLGLVYQPSKAFPRADQGYWKAPRGFTSND